VVAVDVVDVEADDHRAGQPLTALAPRPYDEDRF
jgi:hypothetical protein